MISNVGHLAAVPETDEAQLQVCGGSCTFRSFSVLFFVPESNSELGQSSYNPDLVEKAAPPQSSRDLEAGGSSPPFYRTRNGMIIIAVVALPIIIAAAVGGGVGGKKKKQTTIAAAGNSQGVGVPDSTIYGTVTTTSSTQTTTIPPTQTVTFPLAQTSDIVCRACPPQTDTSN